MDFSWRGFLFILRFPFYCLMCVNLGPPCPFRFIEGRPTHLTRSSFSHHGAPRAASVRGALSPPSFFQILKDRKWAARVYLVPPGRGSLFFFLNECSHLLMSVLSRVACSFPFSPFPSMYVFDPHPPALFPLRLYFPFSSPPDDVWLCPIVEPIPARSRFRAPYP